MKKFLLAAMIFGVVIGQFVAIPRAEAKDVYLGTWEGGWEAYWDMNSTKLESHNSDLTDFTNSCQVKAVSSRGTVKYINYVMRIQVMAQAEAILISFRDSLGGNGTFYLSNPGVYQVEKKLAGELLILMMQFKASQGR